MASPRETAKVRDHLPSKGWAEGTGHHGQISTVGPGAHSADTGEGKDPKAKRGRTEAIGSNTRSRQHPLSLILPPTLLLLIALTAPLENGMRT